MNELLSVGPDFSATMQIPTLRGRPIDSSDRSDSRKVAVANKVLGKKISAINIP